MSNCKLPDKKFYFLGEAAQRLSCSPMDLIHFSLAGEFDIYVWVIDAAAGYFSGGTFEEFEYSGFCRIDTEALERFYFSPKLKQDISFKGPFDLIPTTPQSFLPDVSMGDIKISDYREVDYERLVMLRSDVVKLQTGEAGPATEDIDDGVVSVPKGTAKSIASLLKMVSAMASGGYSYNPEDKKSSVPKQIVEDAEAIGVTITDDTVRKWLKESYLDVPRGR